MTHAKPSFAPQHPTRTARLQMDEPHAGPGTRAATLVILVSLTVAGLSGAALAGLQTLIGA